MATTARVLMGLLTTALLFVFGAAMLSDGRNVIGGIIVALAFLRASLLVRDLVAARASMDQDDRSSSR